MNHNEIYLKRYRNILRNNPTSAESYLWGFLKNSSLCGRKFRRQHSIGNYIVDFYCHEERLIIELDGEIHNYQIKKDSLREDALKRDGLKVLRFENNLVFEDTIGILEDIRSNFNKREGEI